MFKDISGKSFGRLTARWPCGKQKKVIAWLCSCICGNVKFISTTNLGKKTFSCGCLNRENAARKAPFMRSKRRPPIVARELRETYDTWRLMHSRCTKPTDISFRYYGGRGIKVCKRWNKFSNFLVDMGRRPENLTIDRYPDNKGNYRPGNCRWATKKQQTENRSIRIKK